jgi:SAM-dependent methyltransferase
MKSNTYYESNYLNYQKKIGEFGGIANIFKFEKYIKSTDTVLDFGCGGGFLLDKLKCKTKIGIEPNKFAREIIDDRFGFDNYDSIDQIGDNSVDVVISNHCLEHCPNPAELFSKMYDKLKVGGVVIIVVPHDSYRVRYKPNDINFHLYSFSPMNLGNLLYNSGFGNIQSYTLLHKWPPFFFQFHQVFGLKVFHFISFLYGRLQTKYFQTKGVGYKLK